MAIVTRRVGENETKTAVVEKDGEWWLQWFNIVGGLPMGQSDGPFATKEEAENARQKFEQERR